MKQALFYTPEGENMRCLLCPNACLIAAEEYGLCRVRRNTAGMLVAETYGRVSSMHSDPIEKKPLYHFFPGREILSLGTAGCNLRCKFCQNCEISQSSIEALPLLSRRSPEEIVEIAANTSNNLGIAFTYNEPGVWIEFLLDIAVLAKARGLKTVMISNGFINPEPLDSILECVDAFNIDLKGFSEEFYKRMTSSSLDPVKKSIVKILASGKHIELSYLVIPGHNDEDADFESMLNWILDIGGKDIALHISRYFPSHKMNLPPTPLSTLQRLYHSASQKLSYVYLGNVAYQEEGRDTNCSQCKTLIMHRDGYTTTLRALKDDGSCAHCGEKIAVM